jgi:predicted dehydrogenase
LGNDFSKDVLRVGIIGAGRITERAHLPVLNARSDVRVVGLFDPDRDRAGWVATSFGIPAVCVDVDELLRLDLDVVLIACPNRFHAEMTIAALDVGAHVLCEKPMAISGTEAQAMAEAAERSGRELMVGFANRFRPEVVALERTVREGQLGEIVAIRCGWLRRAGVPGAGTWFTDASQSGGGVLIDLGSHLIDLAVWLAGRRELLAACCTADFGVTGAGQADWYESANDLSVSPGDVDVRASGFLVLNGPLDVFVDVSWACALPCDETYLHVLGTRGAARLETVFGFSPSGHRPPYPLRMWLDDDMAHKVAGTSDLLQPYRDQWCHFVSHICDGKSLRPWLEDSLVTVQITDAMYECALQLNSKTENCYE